MKAGFLFPLRVCADAHFFCKLAAASWLQTRQQPCAYSPTAIKATPRTTHHVCGLPYQYTFMRACLGLRTYGNVWYLIVHLVPGICFQLTCGHTWFRLPRIVICSLLCTFMRTSMCTLCTSLWTLSPMFLSACTPSGFFEHYCGKGSDNFVVVCSTPCSTCDMYDNTTQDTL